MTLDARISGAAMPALLAGESQRCGIAAFDGAQTRFFTRYVIACRRRDTFVLGYLDLEHDHVTFAKRHLRAGEVEFPHPHKVLIVEPHHLVAVGEKAFAPRL